MIEHADLYLDMLVEQTINDPKEAERVLNARERARKVREEAKMQELAQLEGKKLDRVTNYKRREIKLFY